MNIYLSGSISAGRGKVNTYMKIVEVFESMGHRLTSPQVADPQVGSKGEGEPADSSYIFQRDIRQIDESEVMIAEVSIPSLGVGYEICYAIQRGIPILCLYDTENATCRLSAMISGNNYPQLQIKEYHSANLESIIRDYLNSF